MHNAPVPGRVSRSDMQSSRSAAVPEQSNTQAGNTPVPMELG